MIKLKKVSTNDGNYKKRNMSFISHVLYNLAEIPLSGSIETEGSLDTRNTRNEN